MAALFKGAVSKDTVSRVWRKVQADWEAEFEQRLFVWACEQVRHQVTDRTWQAFWRLAVENHATAEISADLGLSQGAVRQAKYRVLCRLREEMGG